MPPESNPKKQLVRDIKREALRRMEDAARTVEDFENVTKQWDLLDENRERKERWHESMRSESLLTWGASPDNMVIPIPSYGFVFWRQMMAGDFLDIIYACPYEMHQLAEDLNVSFVLHSMNENHQEILWFGAVCLYNVEQLAALRGCTERNIRKTRELMLKTLRGKLSPRLQKRVLSGDLSVTWNMRDFLARYDETQKTTLTRSMVADTLVI